MTASNRRGPWGRRGLRRGALGLSGELGLGLRLAIAGGRGSWSRLLLGTIGIGLATFVLLVAGSVPHILSTEKARVSATEAINEPTGFGHVAPLQEDSYGDIDFQDTVINGVYLRATGPSSPIPPGLTRVPGPDQAVVSPALARLLASPDGSLLRPRLPAHIIGTVGMAGLRGPQDLTFYAGFTPAELGDQANLVTDVYGFGNRYGLTMAYPTLALLVLGIVALLLPVPIVVLVCGRIAGAARDRRLAAIRLLGADGRQVRRIAAAESLAFAITGLLVGAALFLVFRQLVPHLQFLTDSVFTSDVVVPWPLVALIVVLVPLLTVGSALFASRGIVIEPLGVVRASRPTRRRLWWRLVPLAIGVAALMMTDPIDDGGVTDIRWVYPLGIGTAALIVTVPTLLPYLVEGITRRLRGGSPTWQLAMRRLHADAGTAARMVSGIAVVLAGAIAAQTVLAVAAPTLTAPPTARGFAYVSTDIGVQNQVDAAIGRSGVARAMFPVTTVSLWLRGAGQWGTFADIVGITSCAAIDRLLSISNCHDGDAFFDRRSGVRLPPAGTPVPLANAERTAGSGWTWRVPAHLRVVDTPLADLPGLTRVLLTPGAGAGLPVRSDADATTAVWLDPNDPTAVDRLVDAVAVQPLRAQVSAVVDWYQDSNRTDYATVRTGLLIGSLCTLSLIAVSMLLLALEQIRERRRPLAMLAAVGVSRPTLARSLLWQIALPVAVAVVTADAMGAALGAAVLHIDDTPGSVDWSAIATFNAVAAGAVLLVTVASLPALLRATGLSTHRTE